MISRFMLTAALLLFLAVSASSQNLCLLPEKTLQSAAQRLKVKDYRGAWELAQKAPESPERNFICGIVAHRLEKWEEASAYLGKAAKNFQLLADYALYYQADALFRINRHDEALETVKRFLQLYPESTLARAARMLNANILFARMDFKEALNAYVNFVENYPSGNDSVNATYKSALCREGLGEELRTAQDLRSFWLNYPASPLAEKAEDDLRRLALRGITIAPYTPEELFKRGTALYNLGKYDLAIKTFNSIQLQSQPAEFLAKTAVKTGQALFKARKYREAEQTFANLLSKELRPAVAEEVRFWHAKALDKTGREEESIAEYLKISEASPSSDLADDSLLEAAYIRKFQGRFLEEQTILEKFLSTYPDSRLKCRAQWESAWARYNTKEFKGAAETFRTLLSAPDYREKALYWNGRALEAAGAQELANKAFGVLLDEFPLSFYAFQLRKEKGLKDDTSTLAQNPASYLPVPAGYERVKTLIACGLNDEARKELANSRKKGAAKGKTLLGIARLYLEMDDYSSMAALFQKDTPRKLDTDNLHIWGLLYPRPFSKTVSVQSAKQNISESLIYSLIKAESTFCPTAVSPVGAVGLMQLMPSTAKSLAKDSSESPISTRLTQPDFNIKLGTRHFKGLLRQYNGNIVSAVAAYNAGSSPVDRWRKKLTYNREDEFIENIPYYETREYVKRVLTGAEFYGKLYRSTGAASVPQPVNLMEEDSDLPETPDGAPANSTQNTTATTP